MKKVVYLLNTSKTVAFIEYALSELILISALIYSYKNNEQENAIYFFITIILVSLCIIASIRYSLMYEGRINVIWRVNEVIRGRLNIAWRGASKFLLYNSLVMISYVIFYSDIICISIYLFAIARLIIFTIINIKISSKI